MAKPPAKIQHRSQNYHEEKRDKEEFVVFDEVTDLPEKFPRPPCSRRVVLL
jgi:hypothetical protein